MMTFGSFLWQAATVAMVLVAAVYLPGRLWLRIWPLDLGRLERLAAHWVCGAIGLTLAAWALGWIGWGAWLWLFMAVPAVMEISLSGHELWLERTRVIPAERPAEPPIRTLWPLALLLAAGALVQAWFMVPSGWFGSGGTVFYAWHGHDAPWHVFNIQQLAGGFPPEMPGFSGQVLKNYHYFADLFWGAVVRLSQADAWHVYFRMAPFAYSFMLGLTTFVAARAWTGQDRAGYLAVALTQLSAGFGWVLPLFRGAASYFFWDSVFWVQSPFGAVFNPGVAFSFPLVMFGIWALHQWLEQRRSGYVLLLALAWGVLPGFKVYPALLAVAALWGAGLFRVWFNRDARLLIAAVAVTPLFLLVFLPPNLHAPSLVRLLPGFNLAAMLVAPDRLALVASATLKAWFNAQPAAVAVLLLALVPVFVIGNLGVRSLGLADLWHALRRPRVAEPMTFFLALFFAAALAGPVLFVQTGMPWNTVQFFHYAILISSLPAARVFWRLADPWSRRVRIAVLAALLALGAPALVQALFRMDWGNRVSRESLETWLWLRADAKAGEYILRPLPEDQQTEEGFAKWLRTQERGKMTSVAQWRQAARTEAALVAAPGANTLTAAGGEKILNLGWHDTAWTAAVCGRNTYLEDTVSALILGYPAEARIRRVRDFYTRDNVIQARELLEGERIRYVIVPAGASLPFDPRGASLKKIKSTAEFSIYKRLDPRQ